MSLALHSVVGAIRVEPMPRATTGQSACDDSTLELLLESFARHEALEDDSREGDGSFRLFVSTRLCRIQAAAEGHIIVRANLAQLVSDLTADYERLACADASRRA